MEMPIAPFETLSVKTDSMTRRGPERRPARTASSGRRRARATPRDRRGPGPDAGAVAPAPGGVHARADRRAEHDEVERRREQGRGEALRERAPGARHLRGVDRPNGVDV